MRNTLIFLALVLIAFTTIEGSAERQWVNNIVVDEYDMTWSYTETFAGVDSIAYRVGIDTELGNNDSFVSAWELLNADKEMRKRLRSAIDNELDVRIKTPYLNNETTGVEIIDIDSMLSPAIIGKTHTADTIVNKYKVSYRFKDSIFNASSIWFLGQAKSPVTIILPARIDVTNISGMDNVTKIINDHAEITGFFAEVSRDRGEITINLAKNTSTVKPEVNVTNVIPVEEKATEPTELLSRLRDGSILGAGVVIILLIYIFKLRKR